MKYPFRYMKDGHSCSTVKNNPRPWQIWFAKARYTDGIHSKDRPVMIDRRVGDGYQCHMCTSKFSGMKDMYTVVDELEAGFDRPTYIDYDTMWIPDSDLRHMVGRLSIYDREEFRR